LIQAQIEDTAIKGTLNVLESCAKTRPKRIVFTSSIVTVRYTPRQTPETVFDETFFTDAEFVRKEHSKTGLTSDHVIAYVIGKTLAEEAAWDFVRKHNLDMVVMNPVMVAGLAIQPSLNASNRFPVELLSGTAHNTLVDSTTLEFQLL
jgi:nucleoside-diphosphate-sugar epimerase